MDACLVMVGVLLVRIKVPLLLLEGKEDETEGSRRLGVTVLILIKHYDN